MAAKNVDGYLRWAYNSWPLEPLLDSRFHTWAAGDTYLVYPGNRTSMRFEKLLEGIQAYEKIRILRQEYKDTGDTRKAEELDAALSAMDISDLAGTPAAECLRDIRSCLK